MDERELERAFRVSELIVRYLQGELSKEEQHELDAWVQENDDNKKLFADMTNPQILSASLIEFKSYNKKAAWARLKQRLKFKEGQ